MIEKERQRLIEKERQRLIEEFDRKEKPMSQPPNEARPPYSFFSSSVMTEASLMSASPNVDLMEIARGITRKAEEWNEMSEEQKEPFEAEAKKDKERYDRELVDFDTIPHDIELHEFERKVLRWAADASYSRPRTLVHGGMVCKAWREISKIGREPKTAMALMQMLKDDIPQANDRMAVRVAMSSVMISEGKEQVFEALLSR